MRKTKQAFTSQKKTGMVPLAILASIAALSMSGCSWESDSYDVLVGSDGEINPCPPKVFVNGDGKLCEISQDHNSCELLKINDKEIEPEFINNEYKYQGKTYYEFQKYLDAVSTLEGSETEKTEVPLSYINEICTDIEDCLSKDSTKKYEVSFKYKICPKDYSMCAFDGSQFYCKKLEISCTGTDTLNCKNLIKDWVAGECRENKCYVTQCEPGNTPDTNHTSCVPECITGEHYDSAAHECVKDDINNCGAKGHDCTKIANWVDGECTEGICKVTECMDLYIPAKDGLACASNCESGTHYDNSEQKCVDDDVFNCGSTGYACQDKVAQWIDGSCISGVCTVLSCNVGYKVQNNQCLSDCKKGEHYDSNEGKCVNDDIDNCGSTDHICKDEIKNSADVECSEGKCIVAKCNNGYTVNNNICTSDCTSSQYYDSATGKCEASSITSCGMKDYVCEDKVTLWESGDCIDNVCTLKTCKTGFKVVNNACKPDCGSEQHYNTSTSQCEDNNLNNCGAVGYKCSEKVAQWADGSCVAGVCTLSQCESGYKVVSNACKSDCKTGEHYDSDKSKCVSDDINNCGATSHACKDEIKNSSSVKCDKGVCKVTACNTGYTINNNVCTSSCSLSQYYDSVTGTCQSSNTENCGQKGYDCSTIDKWSEGTCTNNSCVLTKCVNGYKVVNNTCKADCGSEQHYNTSTSQCEDNNLNNCGAVGYKCSEKVAQWADGSCVAGVCTLSQCESGYKVVSNACKSDCKTGEHYDSDKSKCVSDDINNCGATGHACKDEIKNSSSVKCDKGVCKVTACNTGYTINNNVCTSSCSLSQYYNSVTGTCQSSNTENCGQKGYNCSTIDKWSEGTCTNNSCVLTKCVNGYKVVNNTCKADCGSEQHYNTSTSQCEDNNLNNCGAVGYKCSEKVAQWADGSCVAGVCTLSQCESGYKVVSNTCKSDCKTGEHYDSNKTKCVTDDISNCGATNHACKDEIKNSNIVSCSEGKCSVSACNSGYTVNNNTCVSSCTNTQYYDVTCKTSDKDNCGQKDYKCSEHISNWKSGDCTNNKCVVNKCKDGYKVVANECKADCGTTKYYDSSTGACLTSDIANCGQKGYQCSVQVANWNVGVCTTNVCKVTECKTGYKPSSDGKSCVSSCTSGQHYDSNQAKCVNDDSNNCGATGHTCKDEIKNSNKVSCELGKCKVSECNKGYTLNNNTCVSSCNSNTQYYDSTTGQCAVSDATNCGQKNYKCSDHISNWSSGKCANNACVVDECQKGFAVINNECRASCETNQYYDNKTGTCTSSDTKNCGMSGYSCKSIAGWGAGSCTNNRCVASSCADNYHNNLGTCIADTNTCCGTDCVDCTSSNQMCSNGNCNTSCQGGTVLCNDACLTSTHLSDWYHVTVTGSSCSCQSGYTNTNKEWYDGCEAAVSEPM